MDKVRHETILQAIRRLGPKGRDEDGVPIIKKIESVTGLKDISPEERNAAFSESLRESVEPVVEAVEESAELPTFKTREEADKAISDQELKRQNAYAFTRYSAAEVRRAERNLAEAATAWQTKGQSRLRQIDLIRAVNAAEREHDEKVRQGKALPRHVASRPQSVIDQVAQYGMGGRNQKNSRGGDSFRRGAHPHQMFGRTVKTPSES